MERQASELLARFHHRITKRGLGKSPSWQLQHEILR